MPAALTDTVTIRTSLPEADARAIVRDVLVKERRGKPVPSADGRDVVRLGSRVGFRLLGMWAPRTEERLPIAVTSTIASAEGSTVVALVFENDEGWYITRLSVVDDLFRSTFATIAAQIASLLPAAR